VYPITEGGDDAGGIVGETQGGLPDRPATGVLEFLRQVPVVKRGDRPDASRQQAVHQSRVEVDSGLVEGT
jgi:hypothetical protein